MACNMCGEKKVEACENCLNELGEEFKCYLGMHFCGRSCWLDCLVEEEEKELKDAKDD